MTQSFGAQDRANLCEELRQEIYDLIHEHGRMAAFTVAEIIGVLEILKFEIIAEESTPDFEGEDE